MSAVAGSTVGGDDQLSRFVFVAAGLVAASFAVWDLIANFSAADIVGVVVLFGFGVVAVRAMSQRKPRVNPRPAGLWRNLIAVVLTWLTVDFVVGAITGSGDAHHEHWFVMGFALAALWLIMARYWFPRSERAGHAGSSIPPDA